MSEQFTKAAEQKQRSKRHDKVMEERHKLVDRIIENMKQGYIMPKPLWDTSQYQIHNPVSEAHYKGGNLAKLVIASDELGYKDPRWMTFKQAEKMGYRIKKDAVGVLLEKYVFEFEKEKINEETGEKEKVTVKLERPIINHFRVFNAEQITGIPPLQPKQENVNRDTFKLADQLIASSACPVMELNQPKAFYSPANDRITLPLREFFTSSDAFASVLMHEMIHSTGHESRLNRTFNTFGTQDYAKEELRAELGSYFMGMDLGIEGGQHLLDSHTQYLESWIKILENDPNELFRACNDAQKAAEFLEENFEFMEDNLEQKQMKERSQNRETIKDTEKAVSTPFRQNKAANELLNERVSDIAAEIPEKSKTEKSALSLEDEKLLDSIDSLYFDDKQHLHFTIHTHDGSCLEGMYRLLADAYGPENTLININGSSGYPEIEKNWLGIRDRLANLAGFEGIREMSRQPYLESSMDKASAEETVYQEPVVQIIYSRMNHPMLKPGNQLSFVEANRLIASLNKQREMELEQPGPVTLPLYYEMDYKLIYRENGMLKSVRDSYDIGAGESDLLEHILQSRYPVHDAYVTLSMHEEINRRIHIVENRIDDLQSVLKEEDFVLRYALGTHAERLESALFLKVGQNDMDIQREHLNYLYAAKKALSTGEELPAYQAREYSLEEYCELINIDKYIDMWDLAPAEADTCRIRSRAAAVQAFEERVASGEIREKPYSFHADSKKESPQINIDTIRQQTEEYVEQMDTTVIEEAMVMEG